MSGALRNIFQNSPPTVATLQSGPCHGYYGESVRQAGCRVINGTRHPHYEEIDGVVGPVHI